VRHSAPPRRRRRPPQSRPPLDASGPGGSRASARARRGAAPGRGRWLHQIPYAIMICALVLALVWMRRSGQDVRGGTLAVAGILLAAALVRLALPERRAGLLVSRRRFADVAALTALGTGLLVAGLVLPAQ
jgi:hypothetical protein